MLDSKQPSYLPQGLWTVLYGSHSEQSWQFHCGEYRHFHPASRLSLYALNPGHPEMGPLTQKNNKLNILLITDHFKSEAHP